MIDRELSGTLRQAAIALEVDQQLLDVDNTRYIAACREAADIVPPGFTPVDAGVAHEAMVDMLEASRRWNERRPGSVQSQTYARKAADLKTLRDKILDELPPEFHSHRAAYPDYTGRTGE